MLLNEGSCKQIAVGLLHNQLLPSHQTPTPALLTVLLGSVDFEIEGKTLRLNQFDTFNIPKNVIHEVKGIEDKNVFTLLLVKEQLVG